MLPSPTESAALVPTPASIVWRRGGDVRALAAAGYALILQVAHPTVGAGVAEHSQFAADPWGRLLRTLDYVNVTVYGGPVAAHQMGARVRAMHTQIKGVKADGTRYHALEPEAYAWVHGTLVEAIVAGNRSFGRPMRPDQIARFYGEWRMLGRIVGVRERDLPATWPEFRVYFERMVAERLEDTETVHTVLDTLAHTPPPPLLGGPLWAAARMPLGHALRLATVGLMAPELRARLGLAWTRAQRLELAVLGRATRATTRLMPRSLLVMGPSYLRWRGL